MSHPNRSEFKNDAISNHALAIPQSSFRCARNDHGRLKSALLALVMVAVLAPNCNAQKVKVWTRDNIQEWIDSHAQKRARQQLIQSMTRQDREKYNSEGWFLPPKMVITHSQKGQLGRLDFPVYKVMQVLDDKRVLFKVADSKGQRYLAVFVFDDTSPIRDDHRAHESPDRFNLVLFERIDDYVYRDTSNRRKAVPTFVKVDPLAVQQGHSDSTVQSDRR